MLTIFRNDPKLAGLALAAFGVFLLMLKGIYDLAAHISLAQKEYSAIMASGLISPNAQPRQDSSLKERLIENSKGPKEESFEPAAEQAFLYRTAPLAAPASPPDREDALNACEQPYLTAPLKEVP